MNSHQRRKDRKLWCHEVAVDLGDGLGAWDRYSDIWEWCVAQWGRKDATCGWREGHKRNVWQFTCAKKATLFALKWAS